MKLKLEELLNQKLADYHKNPLEQILSILTKLDIDSVNHYRDELLLRNYLNKITSNSKTVFSNLLVEFTNLPTELVAELVELLPKESSNPYVQEMINTLNSIIDPEFVKKEVTKVEDIYLLH